MQYRYTTNAGTEGVVEADSKAEAAVKLEAQFGTGRISLIDGKAPEGVSADADPHRWCAAFKTATARTG